MAWRAQWHYNNPNRRYNRMKGLKIFSIALSITAVSAAFASGWTVNVSTSQGTLFRPSFPAVQTNVPFIVNTVGPLNAPASVFTSALPQVTFLTSLGNPHPILTGDGTFFTGGTYTAAYTITSSKAPLIGFNFVINGFVFDLGQIIWTKKVVDLNTSRILYNGGGVFSARGTLVARMGSLTLPSTFRWLALRRMYR